MAWSNDPLVLYHGTIERWAQDILSNGVSIAKCSPATEFARGFYTTPNRVQAGVHANRLYIQELGLFRRGVGHDPANAVVLKFEVDRLWLAQLETLSFVNPNSDWIAFVDHCRLGGCHIPSQARNYDVVFGPLRGHA